ncbi:MAG: hypothetical protein PHT32_08505 [Candidatus Omnitrophica bacterium]|nr:hypothetical protein [Candidatus Omnitrophota bacterium]
MRRPNFKIILILLLCLSISSHLSASQQDKPLSASVTVNTVFNMSVTPTNIDFGTVDPAAKSSEKSISVSCVTNNNRSWVIMMNALQPPTYQQYTIPYSNFNCAATLSQGSGVITPTPSLSSTPTNIYAAGADDLITADPVQLNLLMSINVPQMQAAGTYSTIITLTMSEQ